MGENAEWQSSLETQHEVLGFECNKSFGVMMAT